MIPNNRSGNICLIVLACWLYFFSCTTSNQLRQPSAQVAENQQVGEPDIKACLIEHLDRSSLAFSGEYRLKLEEAIYRLDATTGALSVFRRADQIVFQNENRFFEIPLKQAIVFEPATTNSRFILDDVPYSGKLIFEPEGRRFVAINELPLESYLMGVVPYEMPTGQPDYREAAFAQAIAARSYAFHRIQSPVSDSYHIRADVRDQVYRGEEVTSPLANKAVSETRGTIISSGGEAIPAYYHSTCGGILESQVDSLAIQAYGLKPALYDITAEEYNCKLSPYYRWIETRDGATILKNLEHEFDIDSLKVDGWLK